MGDIPTNGDKPVPDASGLANLNSTLQSIQETLGSVSNATSSQAKLLTSDYGRTISFLQSLYKSYLSLVRTANSNSLR